MELYGKYLNKGKVVIIYLYEGFHELFVKCSIIECRL